MLINKFSSRGFSMVEVMVTVVILAIPCFDCRAELHQLFAKLGGP